MNFTSVGFIIDVIGSVLLAAVIYYTIRLNQHFQMLQKNRAELARQLSGFAHSTERAEAAIQQVQHSTKESAQQMEELLQRAEMLKSDLGFLVDRASGLADRLESGVRRERNQTSERSSGRSSRRGGRTPSESLPETPARSTAEESLARPTRRRRRSAVEDTENPPESSVQSATEEKPAAKPAPKSDKSSNSELLKVLQGMR